MDQENVVHLLTLHQHVTHQSTNLFIVFKRKLGKQGLLHTSRHQYKLGGVRFK